MTARCDSHSEPRRTGRPSASGRVISDSLALRFAVVIGNRAPSRESSLSHGASAMWPVSVGQTSVCPTKFS